MKKKIFARGRFRINVNSDLKLVDKYGNPKPIFQENFLFRWLIKKGIVSPHFYKIPFLLGYWSTSKKVSNLVVNAGMAGVASRINGAGGEAAFTYIAIGTGTTAPSATDTALESEITTGGGARASATTSRTTTDVTNDTAQNQVTFNFTSSFAITESGVFNAASAGTMLARQTFSVVNVSSGNSLQITWKFDVD